jgi:hypothetical protein
MELIARESHIQKTTAPSFFNKSLEHRKISGEGYVRWLSQSDEMAGIEFYFLDPSSRDWVIPEITITKPLSFIPAASEKTA